MTCYLFVKHSPNEVAAPKLAHNVVPTYQVVELMLYALYNPSL